MMNDQEFRQPFGATLLTVLLSVSAGAAVVALLDVEDPYRQALLFGCLTMIATLVLLPETRIDALLLISPKSFAFVVFYAHLVLAPLSCVVQGVKRGQLPSLPSAASVEAAALINCLAYLCYAVALQIIGSRHRASWRRTAADWATQPSPLLGGLFLGVGIVAVGLRFSERAGLPIPLIDPTARTPYVPGSWDITSALDAMGRPFLAWGVLLFWANYCQGKGVDLRWRFPRLATGAAVLAVFTAFATYGLNRGAIISACVAIAAAFSAKVRRLRFSQVLLLAAGLLLLIGLMGSYRVGREGLLTLRDSSAARRALLERMTIASTIQGQFQAPQFLAFLLDKTGWGARLYWGETLLSSLMHPVPVLGRTFRATSGTTVLNRLIYSEGAASDQILSLAGELFINFHMPGVATGFVLLATTVAYLDMRFRGAKSVFAALAWFYVSYWVIFQISTSLAVLSQSLLNQCAPIYIYVLWLKLSSQACVAGPRRRLPPRGATCPSL